MRRILMKTVLAGCATVVAGLPPAQAQDIKERALKIAFSQQDTHPQGLGAKRFSELVAAKSGGKLKVNLFGGGKLGGDQAMISALQGGTVEFLITTPGLLTSLVKDFEAVELPFQFQTPAEALAVLDSPFGRKLYSKLTDKGLVGMAYWDFGFRNVTNTRKPITRLEDFSGLKLRVVPSAIYVDLFKSLGANAAPLPWPELYGALEQKAFDGQENPASAIAAAKFYEVQKYLSLTRHMYNAQAVLVSKKFWDQLSESERKILTEAMNETTPYQRQVSRAYDDTAIEQLKQEGMKVNDITPAERSRMRDAVKAVIDKHSAPIKETVDELNAELQKVRNVK
jgi:tripartite ATP-independent transporter DctP family solute receptor